METAASAHSSVNAPEITATLIRKLSTPASQNRKRMETTVVRIVTPITGSGRNPRNRRTPCAARIIPASMKALHAITIPRPGIASRASPARPPHMISSRPFASERSPAMPGFILQA